MKTIIAGSRSITSPKIVAAAIAECGWTPTEVVCGRAKGVDTLGEHWAIQHRVPIKYFSPDWQQFGKRAGILRNVKMAEYAQALIAIWDGESKGTKHMIDEAESKCLKVFVCLSPKAKPLICRACECPIDHNGCGCNPHDA